MKNRLTVIEELGRIGHNKQIRVRCICGIEKIVLRSNLKRTFSCGCLNRELGRTRKHNHSGNKNPFYQHGLSNTPAHLSYMYARARCTNPNVRAYKWYGGRGIEFRFNSFPEFLEELGPRPIGLTLDRIDPHGHYEKGNVRWATWPQQRRNQRRCKK